MAILLTTNYQLIGTVPLSYGEIRFYGRYYEQNRENNYTNFQLKMTYYTWQNSLSFSSATAWLNGSRKDYGYTTFYKGETLIMEETRTAYHNQDGSSQIVNVGVAWNASFGGNGDVAVDITFPKIDRYPMITTAPNFSDEDNPTITFTNIMGFPDGRVYACISLTGATDDVPYREINYNTGSYTFELTEAERNTLRNATPNSNSLNVMFYLRTNTGSSSYVSIVTRTMTIVNGNPTFTNTEVETDEQVISVIGTSADTVIQNVSKVKTTIIPSAKKGSSIRSITVTHDGNNYTKTASPYEFVIPITANSFDITVVDSRGNRATSTVTKTMINYYPVDIINFSFERYNPTSSNILVNLEATYYQETFNSTVNVPVVKWKLDDGTETTIPSTEYSIDTTNHKLTITDYELTNILNYRTKGTFTIAISDIFTSDTDKKDVLRGIPTFDYGEHDLKVNGDLYIADTDGQNPVNVLENIVPKYIHAFLNQRYSVSITPWQVTFLQFSIAETNDSNMFIFDDANDRITIGPGVNKIEISTQTTWWGASGTGEFDIQIFKNSYGLGDYSVSFGSTTTDINNRVISPFILSVQEGDFIQVGFITDITSMEVLNNRIYIRKIS